MELSKEQKYQTTLVVLSLIFLILYNFTNLTVWWLQWMKFEHLIFNWPDANANHFFAGIFAQTNQLFFHEPLNIFSDNLLHSRSINISDSSLVPISFLPSIVIFGLFYKLIGVYGVLVITPLLAMFSVWLVYRLVYFIFKDLDIAFITALLFLSLAPWVFFANVVMLPTIMFVFLVLAGWWSIIKSFKSKHNLWWILGSLLLSLAVVVRPTEIIWLALISLFILYINKQILTSRKIVWGILVLGSIIFSALSYNNVTYGQYLITGYSNLQSGNLLLSDNATNSNQFVRVIKLLIVPFGFDFVLILKNFYKYFIDIVLPHFILALAGAILLFSKFFARGGENKKIDFAWRKYLILSPFIFILILVYYGSWDIADPLVKNLNKISISYVRYFMPLYIWILPLVAYAIKKLFMGSSKLNKAASYVIVIALMVSSLKLAFMSENDGLLANRKTLNDYYTQYQTVSELVESNAIIISERSDKVFFPKYKVIVSQGDLPLWERLNGMIHFVPIYYYSDHNDQQITIDREAANQVNLDLIEPSQIWHNFILYKVEKK